MINEQAFESCTFCPTESRDLYKCPKCTRFYCSTRCYRSRGHLKCSESFYQAECEQMDGNSFITNSKEKKSSNEVKRPNTTFEEYMRQHQSGDEANPQIKVNPSEEIVFDSDDEPDYLVDVVRASADQFNELNMNELDRRLLAAGISPGIGASTSNDETSVDEQQLMESLFSRLTSEEQRSFARLAEEIIGDGASTSCFRPPSKTNKKSKATRTNRKR